MVCDDAKTNDFFITAFFIKFYEKENKISYIGAGHNDIIYFNNKKNKIESLKSVSVPLGIFETSKYKVFQKDIAKNDFMVLYTDGLTEATNKSDQMFGLNNLLKVINENNQKKTFRALKHH